jgi:ABC-type lipoprotein release transport system permease subunit
MEVELRGRQFQVVGIFKTGTYVDNEAWVSLQDAQDLLGYGRDVSIFIIPDEGIYHAGDDVVNGINVVERGMGPMNTSAEFKPMLNIIEVIDRTLGVAALLTLVSLLFRTAWLRRRELAILRCIGYRHSAGVVYLLCQALTLAWCGVILGLAGASLLFSFMKTDIIGVTLHPLLTMRISLETLGYSTAIGVLGAIIPATWYGRMNPVDLLRSE